MNFTVKKDEETGEYYIDFEDLKYLFKDPSQVVYYSIDELDNGEISLQFFDEYENLIEPIKNENS